jgi:hypothetical protein
VANNLAILHPSFAIAALDAPPFKSVPLNSETHGGGLVCAKADDVKSPLQQPQRIISE